MVDFFEDIPIVDSCDSVFGVILFTAAAFALFFTIVGYFYIFNRLVVDVREEILSSKWVNHMLSLESSLIDSLKAYQVPRVIFSPSINSSSARLHVESSMVYSLSQRVRFPAAFIYSCNFSDI